MDKRDLGENLCSKSTVCFRSAVGGIPPPPISFITNLQNFKLNKFILLYTSVQDQEGPLCTLRAQDCHDWWQGELSFTMIGCYGSCHLTGRS